MFWSLEIPFKTGFTVLRITTPYTPVTTEIVVFVISGVISEAEVKKLKHEEIHISVN